MHSRKVGLTLTEMLVVIGMIGILVALLLPAIISARERARQMSCANHLLQLVVAIQSYEDAVCCYPPGTVDSQGPVKNVPQGYHHNWIEQILPYLELQNIYNHIDRSVSIYHKSNFPVRKRDDGGLFNCPSSAAPTGGLTSYAAVHHNTEMPIDVDNMSVFFLNSRVRYSDISDGHSNTLFIGDKLPLAGDMGWLSGSRATLRNTGTRINAATMEARLRGYRGLGWSSGEQVASSQGFVFVDTVPEDASTEESGRIQAQIEAGNPIVNGLPTNPTAVGGFESFHSGGVNFAFGDGSLRFINDTIDMQVYQRLGHRADGQLLSENF